MLVRGERTTLPIGTGCTKRARERDLLLLLAHTHTVRATHTHMEPLHVQTLPANVGSDASCSSAGDLQPPVV